MTLSLKKIIKQAGRSVRVIPNTDPALSTAQVFHNQLLSQTGIEFMCVREGNKTVIARSNAVQNIIDYTQRDLGRPKRDAFVGMLPPKLAQTILNLAIGQNTSVQTVLDPFCGTGVILQEAALAGYSVYGSDLADRMIQFSEQNLDWLRKTYDISFDSQLETGDAAKHVWKSPVPTIACEGYLGQPLGGQHPTSEKLSGIIHDCNSITKDFLKNLSSQLSSGDRLCIAIPAWFVGADLHRLPVLDDLKDLGYNRIDFECARDEELIYHREGQAVGRELLVLIKQ